MNVILSLLSVHLVQSGTSVNVGLTVGGAGQVESARHGQNGGISHLQTVGHAVICGAVDFQSNLMRRSNRRRFLIFLR